MSAGCDQGEPEAGGSSATLARGAVTPPPPEVPDHPPPLGAALALSERVRDLNADRARSRAPAERARDLELEAAGISGSRVEIEWTGHGTVASFRAHDLRIPTSARAGASEADIARTFVDEQLDLFGLTSSRSLEVSRTKRHGDDTVVEFEQRLHGLPVFGAQLSVVVRADETIGGVSSHVVPDGLVEERAPRIGDAEAVESVGGDPARVQLGWADPAVFGRSGAVELAWAVMVDAQDAQVFISAETSLPVAERPTAHYDSHIETFQCTSCGDSSLPGDLQYDSACHATGDAVCPVACSTSCNVAPPWPGTSQQVHDNTVIADSYWQVVHGRDGWDGGECSLPLSCNAPMGVSYHRTRASSDTGVGNCNAKWLRTSAGHTYSGAVTMDDDRYCLEVVQHELAHGANERGPDFGKDTICSAGGAIGEGISDTFGELTYLYQHGTADWVHGTGCPSCAGERNSNLAEPGCDEYKCGLPLGSGCDGTWDGYFAPQPDNWANYRGACTGWFNSTIVSKVAHLMARDPAAGATIHWGVNVTGIGPAATGEVWHNMISEGVSMTQSLADWRSRMIDACIAEAPAITNCVNAVEASGIWTADTPASPSWNVQRPVATATQYIPLVGERRYIFYRRTGSGGYQCYRTRSCSLGGACSWSSETCYEQGMADLGPTAANVSGYVFTCAVTGHTDPRIWCDKIDTSGNLTLGPDPGLTAISGEPSIAHYSGSNRLYMTYKKASRVYWRRLEGSGPSTWSWGAEQDAGFDSFTPPVLAAGDGYMFLVYVRPTDRRVNYRRWTGSGWDAGWQAGQDDDHLVMKGVVDRPAASMWRGNLHVAVNGTELWHTGGSKHMFTFSCRAPCVTWATAPTCDQPENAQQWSRLVQHEGTGRAGLHLAPMDGYLQLWHRLGTSDAVNFRSKYSR